LVGGSNPSRPVLKAEIMQKLIQYLKDVRAELIKVSWPARNELVGATVLVIILSIMMAIFVYACDQVINRLVGLLLQINL
jgi:preprotein translocase subunit SecE